MLNKTGLLAVLIVLILGLGNIAHAQEPLQEFPPVYVDLAGVVEAVDTQVGTITVDGITVTLDFATLPAGAVIEVGETITVSGELLEDGSIAADIILDGDNTTDEDGNQDEAEGCGFDGTGEVEGDSGRCHPVLEILSSEFEVAYGELQALRDENYGIGEIARAYLLAEVGGVAVSQITAMRDSGMGWGQIMQEFPDLQPSDLSPGSIIGNGRGRSVRDEAESGNGRGNANGNGNGNGRNRSTSDEADDTTESEDEAGNGRGNGRGNGNGGNGRGGGRGGK